MDASSKTPVKLFRFSISLLLFVAAFLILYKYLSSLPVGNKSFGIDWHSIYRGIKGGKIRYDTGLRNPPWIALLIAPLGMLSFTESWALLSLGTLIVLMISNTQLKNRSLYLGIFLLIASFPSLRQLVDGNLELLVIAGILMLIAGRHDHNPLCFAAGILLASAKPQETWLLLFFIVLETFFRWDFKENVSYLMIVLAVTIPSMIVHGADWIQAVVGIEQRGSIMDASLISTLEKLNIPAWLIIIFWSAVLMITFYIMYRMRGTSFSREQAAYLISASLLLAPYAAGNSMLTILAIGIIPLLFSNPTLGLILLVLINIQYFFPFTFRYQWGALYSSLLFLLCYLVLGFSIRQEIPGSSRSNSSHPPQPDPS
jgi:hypothetical protein